MDSQQEIDRLERQLLELRREFAHYLAQEAMYGKAQLPHEAAKRIVELRDLIQQVKQSLVNMGVPLDNDG